MTNEIAVEALRLHRALGEHPLAQPCQCWNCQASRGLKSAADEIERLRKGLEDAAYALFQLKRMTPDAVPEFARMASDKTQQVLEGHAHEPLPCALTAAKELCDAATSYAGDVGLSQDAWLWDKIHAFEAACCPVKPEGASRDASSLEKRIGDTLVAVMMEDHEPSEGAPRGAGSTCGRLIYTQHCQKPKGHEDGCEWSASPVEESGLDDPPPRY